MKSTITRPDIPKGQELPVLMESTTKPRIVVLATYFQDDGYFTGFAMFDMRMEDGGYRIGMHSATWVTACFKPLVGSITLSNGN